MDQPNGQGSITLNAIIEAEWKHAVDEIKVKKSHLTTRYLERYVSSYDAQQGFFCRIGHYLGMLREPATVAAYRKILGEREEHS